MTVDYSFVKDWAILNDRFFSAREERSGSKVCLIGKTTVEKPMGAVDPVGRELRIQNVPFTIIGMLEMKGQTPRGEDQDDAVFVPLVAAHARLFGNPFKDEVRVILAQVIPRTRFRKQRQR